MDIAVLLRAVPDPIEELELNDDETDLDRDYLGYVLNEFDDHALEEALLLKEDTGGSVTAYALGTADEVEQMLHTAVAKGADRAVKVGDDLGALDAHAQADMFVGALGEHDLILCGVQASDEIDGQVAMLVSAKLGATTMYRSWSRRLPAETPSPSPRSTGPGSPQATRSPCPPCLASRRRDRRRDTSPSAGSNRPGFRCAHRDGRRPAG